MSGFGTTPDYGLSVSWLKVCRCCAAAGTPRTRSRRGTPAFLVDKLLERRVSSVSLERTLSTEDLSSSFDVDHIGTEALLFQTGYLTTGEEELGGEPL